MLHFWLLFYLSEGLIFIPPNNLAFAGVGGRGGWAGHGEKESFVCWNFLKISS